MMLHKHVQVDKEGTETGTTFRLIPITDDSAFLVGEFDLATNKLVMCSKTVKDELQSVPKMSATGTYIKVKNPAPGTQGIEFERRLLPEMFELHISDVESITDFVNLVAINADSFNYRALLNIPLKVKTTPDLLVPSGTITSAMASKKPELVTA